LTGETVHAKFYRTFLINFIGDCADFIFGEIKRIGINLRLESVLGKVETIAGLLESAERLPAVSNGFNSKIAHTT